MDRSAVIYLIDENQKQNNLGIWEKERTERKAYAERTSVSQSEWYEGGRQGLNPRYRFRMFAPDYHGERTLKYDGVIYTIYRTFLNKNEIIDLYTQLEKGVQ